MRVSKTERRVLAVITARGGSQELPEKNIRPFAGMPLIAHTILAAREADAAITRLVLSTDSDEIARIGREWDVEVPFRRPPDLSTAQASSLSVVLHAVHFAEAQERRNYDWVLLLQPTSPLRNGTDIFAALDIANAETSAVISVTPAGHFHPVYLRRIQDGYLQSVDDTISPDTRRQDISPLCRINGAIYLTRRDTLVNEHDFFGTKPRAYVMPGERSADIDDELDFAIAEFIHTRMRAATGADT